MVPAAAILIALGWLGQVSGPAELAGGAIVLGGVILASSRTRLSPPAQERVEGEEEPLLVR